MNKNKARKFYQKRQAEKLAKNAAPAIPKNTAPAGYKFMWNYSLQQFELVRLDELIPTHILNPQNTYKNGVASTLETTSKSAARIGKQNFDNQFKKPKSEYLH